ncbi:restriction endonuclease, SacI family [Promicromonospora sp. NPDC050880]|uniref:restriction endonuclease, SacI family n=1 Tax=Promicromonospora sp. NPDC050880 TaxID=3364406 RepID=UPI00379BF6B2
MSAEELRSVDGGLPQAVRVTEHGSLVFRKEATRAVVLAAAERARSEQSLSAEWTANAITAYGFRRKTDFAFYLAALTARAQTADADVFSIKAKAGRGGYDANGLTRSVGDALAGKGFDLRGLKRAPFNNNPWVDKARFDPTVGAGDEDYRILEGLLTAVSALAPDEAQEALAALLRIAITENEFGAHSARTGGELVGLKREALIGALEGFLKDAGEDGRRCQALLTAALATAFGDSVRSGDIHDPSFRWPGDVQVIDGGEPSFIGEAKHRNDVSESEVAAFVETLDRLNYTRAIYFALGRGNDHLRHLEPVLTERHNTLIKIVTSVQELLDLCFLWSHPWVAPQFVDRFTRSYAQWLRNLGVSNAAVRRWEKSAVEINGVVDER